VISSLQAASVPATSNPVSSAAPAVMATPLPSISHFPPNTSPWLPPRAPPVPLNSSSVPSPLAQPLESNSSFQYPSYTVQSHPVRPNPVLMPLSPAGPGPRRPLELRPARQSPAPFPQVSSNPTPGAPYHAQMRGPPAQAGGMHGTPPPSLGPLQPRAHVSPYTPIQAPRMATPLATSNYPAVRPPRPTSGDFSYQPRQPFPSYQNPGNQFGYQRAPHGYDQPPPRHHGFQYPNQQRAQMDPYGYSWAPRSGQMMRNYDYDRNYDRHNGRDNVPNRAYRAPSGPRGSQYYDPSFKPPYGGPVRPRKERKGEADPEYEDLMASVGVK
jgi:splicing factor 1